LAERAGVAFASAYRELRAMEAKRLVTTEREGGALVYRANEAHPLADALRAMLATPAARQPEDDTERQQVRGQLAALGAPLQHAAVEPPSAPVEETVMRGVKMAHRDPDVARTLPVCLYRQRHALDPERLREKAVQLGEKPALGFFLALTAELSGDRRFKKWAKSVRDGRWHASHAFFHTSTHSARERRLAEERTPPVARRWGWCMNMDFEAFRSAFDKFEPHATA
jgi:hypothetical protein